MWWVFPVLVLGFVVGDRIVNGKNGAAHFEQMQQEFRTIQAPPNSEVTEKWGHFSMWNSHKATWELHTPRTFDILTSVTFKIGS